MAQPVQHLRGGLVLPANKRAATAEPSAIAPLPARLLLPLIGSGGIRMEPCVGEGALVDGGTEVARAEGAWLPLLAPSSGRILGVEDHPVPHPSGLAGPCLVLETDGEDRCLRFPSLPADADPVLIVERARAAAIPGLGGAAFPAWRKIAAGRDGSGIDTLIINGAECEPYISCDDVLMRERATDVIAGARLLLHAVGARRVLIAIEDDKPEALAAMRAAAQGIEVVSLPTRYPEGGERQLIQVLTGREVPAGGRPAQIGVLCHNVGTAAALADAMLRGIPLLTRMVTVTGGAVTAPRNLVARIGTPVRALIDAAGGYRGAPERLIVGGPLMGYTLSDDSAPISAATNCIIAAAPGELATRDVERACIRCGDCAEVCPASLQPQQLQWVVRSRELDVAERLHVMDCIECGCCDLVCPSHIPLTDHFRFAKQEIALRREERSRSDLARQRFESREQRLRRQAAERAAKLAEKRAARGIGKAGGEDR